MVSDGHDDRQLILGLLAAGGRVEHRLDRAVSMIKGISFREYQLLNALGNEHGATATRADLARLVGLTPSGVTRALKPLEKLGFVQTAKSERDARLALATLTEEGRELVGDATGVIDDSIASISALSTIGTADRKRFSEILERLAQG